MSKKITQKQLQKLIIQEARNLDKGYKPKVRRVSPKTKKRIMEARKRQRILEARAEVAHLELLEEGFFDVIKSIFKTGMGLLGDAGKAVGSGITKMAAAANETSSAYASAIGKMSNEKAKEVATSYHKNIADSLKAQIQSKSKEMMAALIKAGVSEEDAKGQVALAIQAATGQALVDTGK